MDIPVYLIAGFLDAGKTSFINGVLRDGFAEEDRTLLICCEEGELEYDPRVLGNVFTYTVDDPAQLTPELFKKLEKQYRPKQVIIEYNGMWMMEPLYRDGLPANWILYQIMCLVDATTFDVYLKNMGQLMMEKVLNADLLIFNRCNEELRESLAQAEPPHGEPPRGHLSRKRGRHERGVRHRRHGALRPLERPPRRAGTPTTACGMST